MDDGLAFESYSDASLRALVVHEQAKRAEAEQDRTRLQAGIARQNDRIIAREQEQAELGRTVATPQEMVAGLTGQNALLCTRVAQMEAENAQLRGSERPAKHQPEPWPSERTKQEREPKVRKQRDRKHNHGRQRMARVDERIRHVVEQCPHCGTALHGGWVHRRVQVIELPVQQRVQVIELPVQQRVQVIEHALVAHHCLGCRRRVLPVPPGSADGRVGQCRFCSRLLALVATMASVERLPSRQIQERLVREYDLPLSSGKITCLLRLVAERGQDAYEQFQQASRGRPAGGRVAYRTTSGASRPPPRGTTTTTGAGQERSPMRSWARTSPARW